MSRKFDSGVRNYFGSGVVGISGIVSDGEGDNEDYVGNVDWVRICGG